MSEGRGKPIARELIYDALFDDAIFEEIPCLLATSVGARSATLAWVNNTANTVVIAHSNYYSADQMADYAANFSNIDPWVNAAACPGLGDQAWNLDELVPETTYRSTPFYNDWIRTMGDDAYHCLGVLTTSRFGQGIIGLHRGKGAALFDRGEDKLLQQQMPDLRRMMTMRGRVTSLDAGRQHESLMLDSLQTRLFLITRTNVLQYCNATAERTARPFWLRNNRVGVAHVEHRGLEAAIRNATDPAGPTATTVAVPPAVDQRAELISVIPFREPGGRRLAMLMISAPPPKPSMERQLHSMFRLTIAEAAVAALLADGDAPTTIAEKRTTSLHTVRAQIKAITAKMGCNRLAEVAAIIARVQAAPE